MARRFTRKPLSEAECDARRRADRDRLEHAARALLTTDGWQRWIRVRASNGLCRYSLGNQMLLASEAYRRGFTPTYVAGFRAWLQLNRVPRKGEGIRILAPVIVKDRDEHGELSAARVRIRSRSPAPSSGRPAACSSAEGIAGSLCRRSGEGAALRCVGEA